jgi:hypothetical protein
VSELPVAITTLLGRLRELIKKEKRSNGVFKVILLQKFTFSILEFIKMH